MKARSWSENQLREFAQKSKSIRQLLQFLTLYPLVETISKFIIISSDTALTPHILLDKDGEEISLALANPSRVLKKYLSKTALSRVTNSRKDYFKRD